jgi:hypothetical protein
MNSGAAPRVQAGGCLIRQPPGYRRGGAAPGDYSPRPDVYELRNPEHFITT